MTRVSYKRVMEQANQIGDHELHIREIVLHLLARLGICGPGVTREEIHEYVRKTTGRESAWQTRHVETAIENFTTGFADLPPIAFIEDGLIYYTRVSDRDHIEHNQSARVLRDKPTDDTLAAGATAYRRRVAVTCRRNRSMIFSKGWAA